MLVQLFFIDAKLMLEPVAAKFGSSLSGLLFRRSCQMILNDLGDLHVCVGNDSVSAEKQRLQSELSDRPQYGTH